MKSILMIVGNGLSMDLRDWAKPQLENWNPAMPLQWDLYTPGNLDVPWLQSLPQFERIISSLRQETQDMPDFDIFEKSLHLANRNCALFNPLPLLEAEMRLVAEMQHFLAIAYSYFQIQVDKINLSSWPWVKWFNAYGKNIRGAVSFNYELVLESALRQTCVSVQRFGLKSELIGIPVLKPHGSIDFETAGIRSPAKYPMGAPRLRNDFPIKLLERAKLLKPRIEADIVLPYEYSTQLNYQWVKPGYNWFRSNGNTFTHCIIVGLSYWSYDRPEIDCLLDSLSNETKLIVANIDPPSDLMNKLRKEFSDVKVWENGPKNLS